LPRQSAATAGGIGGLLSMTLNTELGPASSNSMYYHCDGNGNVTMLINPSQYIVAKYLYDAFGNILSKSGLLADANLYRFSSKEAHLNSGLVYYLYRYLDPNLQSWPNRDPFVEHGFEALRNDTSMLIRRLPPGELIEGPNLYEFVANDPILRYDRDGLATTGCHYFCVNVTWPIGQLFFCNLLGIQSSGCSTCPSSGAVTANSTGVFIIVSTPCPDNTRWAFSPAPTPWPDQPAKTVTSQ
jgi:RHS repeat-associated protein